MICAPATPTTIIPSNMTHHIRWPNVFSTSSRCFPSRVRIYWWWLTKFPKARVNSVAAFMFFSCCEWTSWFSSFTSTLYSKPTIRSCPSCDRADGDFRPLPAVTKPFCKHRLTFWFGLRLTRNTPSEARRLERNKTCSSLWSIMTTLRCSALSPSSKRSKFPWSVPPAAPGDRMT